MSPLSNLGGVPVGPRLRRLVRRPITPIDGATLAAIGGDGRIRVVLTGNSLRRSEVPRIDTSTRDFRAFFFFFSVVSFVDLTFSLGLDGNEIDLAAIGNVIKSVSIYRPRSLLRGRRSHCPRFAGRERPGRRAGRGGYGPAPARSRRRGDRLRHGPAMRRGPSRGAVIASMTCRSPAERVRTTPAGAR